MKIFRQGLRIFSGPPLPAETRGLAGSHVTAQPFAGHHMPFDNCPEPERAPELAGTGVF